MNLFAKMLTNHRRRSEMNRRGFSLVELIVVIGILAVLVALLAPSLLGYVERSRASDDLLAMDEIVKAVSVGIAEKECYDEVLKWRISDNVACYIDKGKEEGYTKVVTNKATDKHAQQYKFNDETRLEDGVAYVAAGNMRGFTITLEPDRASGGGVYVLKDAVINKFVPSGGQKLGDSPILYDAVRSVMGEEIELISATYRNSDFTIFIRLATGGTAAATAEDKIEVYGQFGGTNLPFDVDTDDVASDRNSGGDSGNNDDPTYPNDDPIGGGGTTDPPVATDPPITTDPPIVPVALAITMNVPETTQSKTFTVNGTVTDPTATVKINGNVVSVASNGTWSTQVTLDSESQIGRTILAEATNATEVASTSVIYTNRQIDTTTRTEIGYTGAANESLSIPATYTHNGTKYLVYKIADKAFLECSGLTSNLFIPDSVTEVGVQAFKGCTGLTTATIPASVTKIGDSSFSDCTNLTTFEFKHDADDPIELPTRAGSEVGAFYVSSTLDTTVVTNNNTIKNYDWATDNRNVNDSTTESTGNIIPMDGVYYVGVQSTEVDDFTGEIVMPVGYYTGYTAKYEAGDEFPSVVSDGDIYVYGDYEYRYNYQYRQDAFFSTWVSDTSQNGWGVRVLNETKTSYGEILQSINGKAITDMSSTFSICESMTSSPTIPSSVTSLSGTYWCCGALTTAPTIPNGVTDLATTFTYCSNLKTYEGSSDPDGDFSNYVIPNGVTNMMLTFGICDNFSIPPTIPSSVTNMHGTFDDTALTIAPIIPSGVTNVYSLFASCDSLKTYVGSKDPDGDFSNYVIPNDTTDMSSMFNNCALITDAPIIPDGVTNLNWAFKNCGALIAAPTIPNGVTSIVGIFDSCDSLKTYIGSKDSDGDFSNYEIPNSVTDMGDAFRHCGSLVIAPDLSNLTNLKDMSEAFASCHKLETVPSIPNGVTDMEKTFYLCDKLKSSPAIPSSVKNMNQTFFQCTSLAGEIEINANPSNTLYCFRGTVNDIVLTGSSTQLSALAGTATNNNITVK